MLACACGAVLVAGDMCRAASLRDEPEATNGALIPRIVCIACAGKDGS